MGLATSRVCHVCVWVKSAHSEQSMASPLDSDVLAQIAAWGTLPPLTGRTHLAGRESTCPLQVRWLATRLRERCGLLAVPSVFVGLVLFPFPCLGSALIVFFGLVQSHPFSLDLPISFHNVL